MISSKKLLWTLYFAMFIVVLLNLNSAYACPEILFTPNGGPANPQIDDEAYRQFFRTSTSGLAMFVRLRRLQDLNRRHLHDELLAILEHRFRTERIVDRSGAGMGMTYGEIVRFESGLYGFLKMDTTIARDQQIVAEVGASVIDRALQLDLVPPTFYVPGRVVSPSYSTRPYTLQLFIEGPGEAYSPPPYASEFEVGKLRLLDYLIQNWDRTSNNTVIITEHGWLVAIDNAMGFPSPFRVFSFGNIKPPSVREVRAFLRRHPALIVQLRDLQRTHAQLLRGILKPEAIWGFGRRLARVLRGL